MQSYQPHKITRSRVIVSLMVSAMLASCAAPAANRGSSAPVTTSGNQPMPVSPTAMAQTKANVAAGSAKSGQEEIRFTDVASCKVETERLNAEYAILKDAFDDGKLTGSPPVEPTLKPDECEEFITSAQQKYAAQAPTYADSASCEASGAQCERVAPSPNNNYVQPVYRPVFFGSYGYNPWVQPIYIGGRRDYGQQTVIIERDRGSNVNSVVGGSSSGNRTSGSSASSGTTRSTTSTTPSSTTSKTTSKTTKPGSFTPSKPSTTSGKGAIGGRGSSGFGSSYGYSGRGGK